MSFLFHVILHLFTLSVLVRATEVFERVPGGLPEGWTAVRVADADEQIKLRVALRQQNVDLFDQTILAVSTPGHPQYGQHLESHEIRDLLRPTDTATNAVISWLEGADIKDIEEDGDWIHFRTNVSSANALLDTTFTWYRSPYKRRLRLRTLQYSVPNEVAQHINLVQPTTRFGTGQPLGSNIHSVENFADFIPAGNRSDVVAQVNIVACQPCNVTITPQCLLDLYNVKYWANDNDINKVAFASFLEEYARYDDLARFEAEFVPWANNETLGAIAINGGLNIQDSNKDSNEANLDAQYLKAISAPIPEIEFSTAGRGPFRPDLDLPSSGGNMNEPYLEYLLSLRNVPNEQLPQTISHSYGEDEQSVPAGYAIRVCQLFGELAARGVSVIFSSGDSGVGTSCKSNTGDRAVKFQPQFPAACPWVTSVGGTQSIAPEQAAYFSSGGFSAVFQRPAYQDASIQAWLKQSDNQVSFGGLWNPNGRGFPDVSAQAYRYAVMDQGSLKAMQGTSCAAPTFAGIVALLNGARLSSGLSPLGFLNPWLYGAASAGNGFTDITEGGSTGCLGLGAFGQDPNGGAVVPGAGWNATVGWDPVTGLGTPDFEALLKVAAPAAKNEGRKSYPPQCSPTEAGSAAGGP